MFDLLSSFYESVVAFFESVGEFLMWVGELLSDIVSVAGAAYDAASDVKAWISDYFPAQLLALFALIIAVVVIYKVLGREG